MATIIVKSEKDLSKIKAGDTVTFDLGVDVSSIEDPFEAEELLQKENKLIEKMNDLKAKIVQDKKNDLLKYKDEIKRLLRQEIVSRYYLHKGDMQAALKGDPDLKTAIEVLSNEDQYQDILSQ